MTITIAVEGRIATATATTQVVAGNTYPVAVSLDSEWTGNLFMRVRFGSLYYDIPFASTDTAVNVQFPVGYPEVGIGIFSEALQVCTNEVRVKLLRSILEAGEQVVEFDGDLYDQWEGEVTTLLTDDAFDAESTRPVQNAVITAWKGTVALDASVVHNTGNETIAGAKEFTSIPVVSGTQATVDLASTTPASTVGWKAQFRYRDQDSLVASTIVMTGEGSTQVETRIYKPDRSNYYWMRHTAYSDHELLTIQPYYPVDSGGNPQPLTAGALVSSGSIAVDPRIVHSTGNESVAGIKTFTSGLNGWATDWHRAWASSMAVGQYCIFAKITPVNTGHFRCVEFIQGSNTTPEAGMLVVKDMANAPLPVWAYRTKQTVANSSLTATSVVILSDGTYLYLAWKKEYAYGTLMARESMHVSYGVTQSMASSPIEFYAQGDMPVLNSLDGYTVYQVVDA